MKRRTVIKLLAVGISSVLVVSALNLAVVGHTTKLALSSEITTLRGRLTTAEAQCATLQREVTQLREQVELQRMEYTENVLNWDFDYVTRVVAAECLNEPFEGQLAVAQTIRERAVAWGLTPEQVVKQANQYATPRDISEVSMSTVEACERVLINGESVVDEPIKWFYSTRGGFVARGHEKRQFVTEIGYHRFFK